MLRQIIPANKIAGTKPLMSEETPKGFFSHFYYFSTDTTARSHVRCDLPHWPHWCTWCPHLLLWSMDDTNPGKDFIPNPIIMMLRFRIFWFVLDIWPGSTGIRFARIGFPWRSWLRWASGQINAHMCLFTIRIRNLGMYTIGKMWNFRSWEFFRVFYEV